MNLAEYQECLSKALFSTKSDLVWTRDTIVPAGKLNTEEALEVYRSNTHGACINTLKQIFPICMKVLGVVFFTALAKNYVQKYPSKNSDLNTYGSRFSEFINSQKIYQNIARDLPYLKELALLEWDLHAVYYVEDDENFDWSSLQTKSVEEQLKLKPILSHSLRLLNMQFPVDKIWFANKTDEASTITEYETSPYHLVISRYDYRAAVKRITVKEYVLLNMLLRDTSNMQELTEKSQELGLIPSEFLAKWMKKSWIVGMRL